MTYPPPPSISVGASDSSDSGAAAWDLARVLREGLDADPDLVLVYGAAGHHPGVVRRALREAFPAARVAGASSSLGVMSSGGMAPGALGAIALRDEAGAFGVGAAPAAEGPGPAAARATRAALRDSGRSGRPDLLWLCCPPGDEAEALEGIEAEVGAVPVLGGAAGSQASGEAWQLHPGGYGRAEVVVAALHTSAEVGCSFHVGFAPAAGSSSGGRVWPASIAGVQQMLLARAGRVAQFAQGSAGGGDARLLGAVVVFCSAAGLVDGAHMHDVAQRLRESFGGAPFLGAFTVEGAAGVEAGASPPGHLMISVLTLHVRDRG